MTITESTPPETEWSEVLRRLDRIEKQQSHKTAQLEEQQYAPTPEHHLAITTDKIVERLSGEDQDFDTVEKTAHLKAGLEIPLMVVGSIPDDLELIYKERLKDKKRPLNAKKRLRYLEAINRMRSLDRHFLHLTVASDKHRAEQLVTIGKAIQGHHAETTEDPGRLERIMNKVRGKD